MFQALNVWPALLTRNSLSVPPGLRTPQWQKKLAQIRAAALEHYRASSPRDRTTVLMGHSFSIFPPSFAFDSLLGSALMLRNVRVLTLWCDGIQEQECNVYGGAWLGHRKFEAACRGCQLQSKKLLGEDNPDYNFPLSSFSSERSLQAIISENPPADEIDWAEFEWRGLPLGQWASAILRNNATTDSLSDIPHFHLALRNQVLNLFKVSDAYEKALDQLKPDRIFSQSMKLIK